MGKYHPRAERLQLHQGHKALYLIGLPANGKFHLINIYAFLFVPLQYFLIKPAAQGCRRFAVRRHILASAHNGKLQSYQIMIVFFYKGISLRFVNNVVGRTAKSFYIPRFFGVAQSFEGFYFCHICFLSFFRDIFNFKIRPKPRPWAKNLYYINPIKNNLCDIYLL